MFVCLVVVVVVFCRFLGISLFISIDNFGECCTIDFVTGIMMIIATSQNHLVVVMKMIIFGGVYEYVIVDLGNIA